jgi:tetratricopeptide (TPR) repeat protein
MGKKGFGQSVTPTRAAKDFMREFIACCEQTQGDQPQIHQFFKANQSKLNESLLDALPAVFSALLLNKSSREREKIAQAFGTFGNLISQFPLGSRTLNLELSITAYKLVQQVYTREAFPEQWAQTQNNLGIAYSDRIRGEQAESIEQAIENYKLALQVFTREAFPEEWAMTQNNLGNAYSNRIRGERAENLEQAIAAYELVLQVYTRQAFPEQWAGIQSNLGNTYKNRIRGERAENIEQAITAHELALQVYTRQAFPEQWAMTQNNLGNAYRDRIYGEQAENLEQAIAAYELVLQVYTRRAFPEQWAMSQGNLAEALRKQASLTGNYANLETATILLLEALEILPHGSPEFIEFHYTLGNVLSLRYEYSHDPHDLEQALQAYKTALDLISPEHYDRKQIWQALPTTQSILGSRLVRDGEWQEGLKLLLNSLKQLRTEDNPLAHASALFQTGRAYEVMADLENARLYYRDALRLYEHLKDPLGIAQSRAGLGSVLASAGYMEKGSILLGQALEGYHELQRSDKVAEVEKIYQMVRQALEQQEAQAYV